MKEQDTTQTNHTPGPWVINYHAGLNEYIIGPGKGLHIAPVLAGSGRPDAKANATLMAAAPDLLAALEALTPLAHDMHISHQMGKFDSWAIDAAEAAIAKARGLEPGAIDPACHCAECGAFDKADAVLIEWEGEPRCPDCRPENAAPGGNSMKRTYGFRDIVKLFVDDSKNDPTLKRDTIIVGLLLLGMIITGVLGV